MSTCDICDRFHEPDEPCPRRLANAYLMRPLALVTLTIADKVWMANNTVDIPDLLEEHLAERMEVIDETE